MENLRITLAAGETKVFVKAGRYFEIVDSIGPVTIGFYDANGSQNNDATNVQSGFYLAENYSQFDIYSATAQTVEVFISDASAGSKRQPGVVRVIDGERDKVLAGVCFRGGAAIAGAANGPFVQVSNPPGSNMNLFIQAVRMGSLQADSYGIGTSASQLPTLVANATTNLNRSGAASAAQMRTDNTGTAQAATKQIAAGYVQASSDSMVVFPRPLLIRPGESAYCYVLGLTNNLRATFEWEEWPV